MLYERLDGQTHRTLRQKKVDKFNKSSRAMVFLLSTKAAGLGLNITGASRVIVYDRKYLTLDAFAIVHKYTFCFSMVFTQCASGCLFS